jgi:hypothetical protein
LRIIRPLPSRQQPLSGRAADAVQVWAFRFHNFACRVLSGISISHFLQAGFPKAFRFRILSSTILDLSFGCDAALHLSWIHYRHFRPASDNLVLYSD